MAVGDDAKASGFPLVPDAGEEGRVRWGAREINRTRDFIAQVKTLLTNHTHIDKGPFVYFLSCSTGLVANGTSIIPSMTFPSLPFATRVFIHASGQAGANSLVQSTALRISGSRPIVQTVEYGVPSDATKMSTVVRSGYMDIPASTTATLAIQGVCTLAGGKAYYRVSTTYTRVHT